MLIKIKPKNSMVERKSKLEILAIYVLSWIVLYLLHLLNCTDLPSLLSSPLSYSLLLYSLIASPLLFSSSSSPLRFSPLIFLFDLYFSRFLLLYLDFPLLFHLFNYQSINYYLLFIHYLLSHFFIVFTWIVT